MAAETTDATPGVVAEKLDGIAEDIESLDTLLVDGDTEAALEFATEMKDRYEAFGCPVCYRLGVGLVGAVMWAHTVPDESAKDARIEAVRGSLARQRERLLSELSEVDDGTA